MYSNYYVLLGDLEIDTNVVVSKVRLIPVVTFWLGCLVVAEKDISLANNQTANVQRKLQSNKHKARK